MKVCNLIGVGLLVGWFVHPLGYLLVAWGAWRLQDQTRMLRWLIVSSVAAALGQTANGSSNSTPWSFGAVAGLVTEVLVCTLLIDRAASETARSRARFLRLALPVSYAALALAWLPTHGVLGGQSSFTAALIAAVAINLGLSVALAFSLLNSRAEQLSGSGSLRTGRL